MLVMMIVAIALMIGSGHGHMGMTAHEVHIQQEEARIKVVPKPTIEAGERALEQSESKK